MKTRGLFLSALMMGAVMAGCSNEEAMNTDNENSLKKSDNYIAVNIVAPSEVATRGTSGENDFDSGLEEENNVKNAFFVFYNANGGVVDAVPANDLEWSEGSGSVSMISSMIVLSDPPTWPTQVVALLNTDFTELALEAMPLDQLLAKTGNYSSTDAFVMSNSVYKNGDKVINTTPLTDANIASTEDGAKNNPVSIPVERVLAKVSAGFSNTFKVIDPEVTPQLNGETVKFVPKVTGMALVHANPESYLVKNIDGVTGWTGWNDADDWRSYWANSAVPADGYQTLSWNAIDAQNENAFLGYCHENTSVTSTKLLVTAQFKAEGAEDYVTVIKYNGTYYTEEGLKNYLNIQYFNDITHGTDNSNDWIKYMAFVNAGTENEWEVKLALVDEKDPEGNVISEVPNANGSVDLEAVLTSINSKTMSQWTDGKCYYFVNIEHFGTGAYGIGVVRNHWYQLTLNSIQGLGTPVFDPTKNIVPDKPEEENYYVAAEVKILKWKVVSQSVALQ